MLAKIRIHTVHFKCENLTLLAPGLLSIGPFNFKNERL